MNKDNNNKSILEKCGNLLRRGWGEGGGGGGKGSQRKEKLKKKKEKRKILDFKRNEMVRHKVTKKENIVL